MIYSRYNKKFKETKAPVQQELELVVTEVKPKKAKKPKDVQER